MLPGTVVFFVGLNLLVRGLAPTVFVVVVFMVAYLVSMEGPPYPTTLPVAGRPTAIFLSASRATGYVFGLLPAPNGFAKVNLLGSFFPPGAILVGF